MLSREFQRLEEDSGEVRNERFLKALTVEVEEISQEAVRASLQEEKNMVAEIEEKSEEAPEFLQTRMVGLSEVRKNLEEWKPSMRVWSSGGRVRGSGAHQQGEAERGGTGLRKDLRPAPGKGDLQQEGRIGEAQVVRGSLRDLHEASKR